MTTEPVGAESKTDAVGECTCHGVSTCKPLINHTACVETNFYRLFHMFFQPEKPIVVMADRKSQLENNKKK